MSEKMGRSPASAHDVSAPAHGVDEHADNVNDEATCGLGDKVRDAGSQIAGHATELLKEAQTRGASVVGQVKDQAVTGRRQPRTASPTSWMTWPRQFIAPVSN